MKKRDVPSVGIFENLKPAVNQMPPTTTTHMSLGLRTVQWTQELVISGKVCGFYLNINHDNDLDYENISILTYTFGKEAVDEW